MGWIKRSPRSAIIGALVGASLVAAPAVIAGVGGEDAGTLTLQASSTAKLAPASTFSFSFSSAGALNGYGVTCSSSSFKISLVGPEPTYVGHISTPMNTTKPSFTQCVDTGSVGVSVATNTTNGPWVATYFDFFEPNGAETLGGNDQWQFAEPTGGLTIKPGNGCLITLTQTTGIDAEAFLSGEYDDSLGSFQADGQSNFAVTQIRNAPACPSVGDSGSVTEGGNYNLKPVLTDS
jgi:hypothetical protein